jgi:hypothetical protein
MDELDRRLATIARSAAERAELAAPAAVRGRGRAFAVRRRTARGAGVVAIVVILAGGFAIATRQGRPVPADPAGGLAPPVSAAPTMMPAPTVTRGAKGAMTLRGATRAGGSWTYSLHYQKGKLCEDVSVAPSGAGSGGCGGNRPEPEQRNRANAGCSGGDMDGDTTPGDGAGAYDSTITGMVDPRAAMVRLELLDGRRLLVRPVADDHFGFKLFGTWLPECVSYADATVLDAAGRVIAHKPPYAVDLYRASGDVPGPPGMPGDAQVELTFDARVPKARRTGFLLGIELRGAELYEVKGDRYRLVVQISNHLDGLKVRLEQARQAGLLTYEVTPAKPVG